jgi:hypothetical protein
MSCFHSKVIGEVDTRANKVQAVNTALIIQVFKFLLPVSKNFCSPGTLIWGDAVLGHDT